MLKKSLLTLTLLAFVGAISAQSLRFEHEGTVYQEGQTIVLLYDEDFEEYHQSLQIRNLTDDQLDVIVEKEVIQDLAGTSNYFCWANCYSNETTVSDPNPVPAQSLSTDDLSIHFQFEEGVEGRVVVKLMAYARSNPDEKISLIFQAGSATGVDENSFVFGSAYPNPASSLVSFNLKADKATDINVTVYNLLGQEVKSQVASGTQSRVSIAVDDLQPGIYFCRFQVNNEVVRTEKFIVKR